MAVQESKEEIIKRVCDDLLNGGAPKDKVGIAKAFLENSDEVDLRKVFCDNEYKRFAHKYFNEKDFIIYVKYCVRLNDIRRKYRIDYVVDKLKENYIYEKDVNCVQKYLETKDLETLTKVVKDDNFLKFLHQTSTGFVWFNIDDFVYWVDNL